MTTRTLRAFAEQRLGDLREPEQLLLDQLEANSELDPPTDRLAEKPAIRAALLAWLCTSHEARRWIGPRGMRLTDFGIDGPLDLRFLTSTFPLIFERCTFSHRPVLSFAQLPQLRIFDCDLPGILASQIQVAGSLFLTRSRIAGTVDLPGARIGGNLRLFDTQIRALSAEGSPQDTIALNLEGATIQGLVDLKGPGFLAHGALRFFGTTIGLNLECSGTVWCPEGIAFEIEQATIKGSVLLRSGFRILGKLRLYESTIAGSLDLQGARIAASSEPAILVAGSSIGRSMLLHEDRQKNRGRPARIVRGVIIRRSSIGENLDCTKAVVHARASAALDLVDLSIKGRLIVNRIDMHGNVRLDRAQIANDIEFFDARLRGEAGQAISGVGLSCGGNFLLLRAEIIGSVHLLHLRVGADLVCERTKIEAPASSADLVLEHAKVEGNLVLESVGLSGRIKAANVTVKGAVNLRDARTGSIDLAYATIGLDLLLMGSKIAAKTKEAALDLSQANVRGSVFTDQETCFAGTVRLVGCNVVGKLSLNDARLNGGDRAAIRGGFMTVGGDLELIDSRVIGEVDLEKARVGGRLDLSGIKIECAFDYSVTAIGCTIGNGLQLGNGLDAKGGLQFDRAGITGDVSLDRSRIASQNGIALSLQAITLSGDLYIGPGSSAAVDKRGSEFDGGMDLSRAMVTGDVDLSRARLRQRNAPAALSAARTTIAGTLRMTGNFSAEGLVDLSNARVQSIEDDEACWPALESLLTDGLTYETLKPLDARNRLRWLERGPVPRRGLTFSWQPYDQLVRTLQRQGLDRDGREIAIAKQRRIHVSTGSMWSRLALGAYRWTMAYGYKPQRALYAAPILILAMTGVLEAGGSTLMVRNDATERAIQDGKGIPRGYPDFSSLAYAIDSLVPIISLQQKEYWRPDSKSTCSGIRYCGWWLRFSLWLYVAAGWLITTLAVAGFTGLIRRG